MCVHLNYKSTFLPVVSRSGSLLQGLRSSPEFILVFGPTWTRLWEFSGPGIPTFWDIPGVTMLCQWKLFTFNVEVIGNQISAQPPKMQLGKYKVFCLLLSLNLCTSLPRLGGQSKSLRFSLIELCCQIPLVLSINTLGNVWTQVLSITGTQSERKEPPFLVEFWI